MTERPIQELLKQLGDAPIPSDPATPQTAMQSRERVIGSIETTLRQVAASRARRRPLRRTLTMLSFAACAAASVAFAWQAVGSRQEVALSNPSPAPTAGPLPTAGPKATTGAVLPISIAEVREVRGTVVVRHNGRDALVAAKDVAQLFPGDRVSTAPQGHARVLFPLKSAIDVDDAAQIDARTPSQMELLAGRVLVTVPSEDSLVVLASDVEVFSRGGQFTVSTQGGGHGPTSVTVLSGQVTVRHAGMDLVLHEGMTWPLAPASVLGAPSHGATPPSRKKEAIGTTSTLDAQNELLHRALEARLRGDDDRALRALDELLARFPGSPLAPEARVERFRALDRAGQHAAAQEEARRYLAKYPEGTARVEAKALVAP